MSARIRPGDIVEVKAAEEILQTLDADGALDHLPFMPEMIVYCGKRFQVSRRATEHLQLRTISGLANVYEG